MTKENKRVRSAYYQEKPNGHNTLLQIETLYVNIAINQTQTQDAKNKHNRIFIINLNNLFTLLHLETYYET